MPSAFILNFIFNVHLPLIYAKFLNFDIQFCSISNLLVARGEAYPSVPSVLQSIEHKVKMALHPVTWNPFHLDVWTGWLKVIYLMFN